MRRQPPPSPPRQSGAAKKLKYAVGFIALAIAAIAVLWGDRLFDGPPGIDPTPWKSDLDAVMTESKNSGKPTLLYFTADWCQPCKQMRRDVFPNDRVQALLRQNFVLVKVDLTHPDSAMETFEKKWEVRAIPTFVALSPNGAEIDRTTGGMHLDGMVSWLESIPALAKRASVPGR